MDAKNTTVGSCSLEYQKPVKPTPLWEMLLFIFTINAVALLLFVAVVL